MCHTNVSHHVLLEINSHEFRCFPLSTNLLLDILIFKYKRATIKLLFSQTSPILITDEPWLIKFKLMHRSIIIVICLLSHHCLFIF